jgi:hypothetical protein
MKYNVASFNALCVLQVFSCDRVFVLSTVAMQANKLNVKDWILDIQMHKKLAEQKAGQLIDGLQLSFVAIHKDFAQLVRMLGFEAVAL